MSTISPTYEIAPRRGLPILPLLALDVVEGKIRRADFETWIEPLAAIGREAGVLVVRAANVFAREQAEKILCNYQDKFKVRFET